MADLVGTKLGQYEIREFVAAGGMAEVYKGYHSRLQVFRAIKVPKPERRQDQAFIESFSQEAVKAAQIRHANVVTIYDVGEQDGLHYIVMEFLSGQTLKDMIRTQGSLPPKSVCNLFDAIADALNFAHSQNYVHCDVKPSNILVDADGQPKLTDFGIARAVTQSSAAERHDRLVGSPRYMSPEHVLGRRLDHRSDIYSLGVVLFEMLTGRVPFDAGRSTEVLEAQVSQRPPRPSTVNKTLPAAVDGVVLRALDKNPNKRYQNTLQMARDLRQALLAEAATTPKPAPKPVVQPAAPPKPPRPLPWGPMALLAVAAVVLVGAYKLLPIVAKPAPTPTATPVPAISTPVPTVIPSPSEVLLPTSTPTSPGGPTSTLVPTQTGVPLTSTPAATNTQKVTVSYPPPELQEPAEGAGIKGDTIHLRWSWSRELKADEYFDLWVWPKGEAERALQGTRSTDMSIYPPGGVGVYYWKVRVARVEPGKPGTVPLGDWSPTYSFDYKGKSGGSAEPTREPGPQPEPTR